MIPSAQRRGQGVSSAPTRPDAPQAESVSNMQAAAHNSRPNIQSCQFCRKRKIKCDKLEGGCSQCTRAQNECVYPASQRKGRPRKAGTSRPAPAPTAREAQLLKRIWKLERLVSSMSGQSQPEHLDANLVAMGHPDVDDEESPRTELGRLVIGRPYLNDTFWSNQQLMEDVLKDSDEDSSENEDDENASGFHSPEVFPANFIFDINQTVNLKSFHPPVSQIQLYWRLYLENCEGIIRMFHTPTTSKIIDQAQTNLKGLSRSSELVMFAIYFTTVTAMSQEEVRTSLGGDKAALLSQYQVAVQKAMVNVGFLYTQDLTVLQAFVLYLISIRHNDITAVWTMTGLAIRIAHGMGIDRDGELFKLNPLETELRRRVWHQILLLDLRASEERGALPTHLSYDTKLPLNINDGDLGADTHSYPKPRIGLTEMTASLVRLEFCEITRRLHKSSPMAVKEKIVEDFSQRMEMTHLKDCMKGGRLEHWCATIARLIMKRMVLMLFKREKDLSSTTRERLFYISIDIIDLANQLRKDAYAGRWDWLIRTHMQWHALAVVLGELAEQSPSGMTEKAWEAIGAIEWEEPEYRAGRILSQSVKRMLIKAQAHRDAQKKSSQTNLEQPEQMSSSYVEPYLVTHDIFSPALLGNSYNAPTTYLNLENHQDPSFFMGQQISPFETARQQPLMNWYFDPTAVHPLPEQEQMAFVTEYWKGFDMVRDDPMHRGNG